MKHLFLFLTFAACRSTYAQEPADALRSTWNIPSGTARQQSIGGAIGSLGGDISATFVNPAGLGFYKRGEFVLTPRFSFGTNKATYLGRQETTTTDGFQLGTTGIASSFPGSGSDGNVTIAFAYNRAADFNNYISYRGLNTQSSYSQKYLEEFQNAGVLDSSAAFNFPNGASLALNTYWLDPVRNNTGNVIGFSTKSPVATGVYQENVVQTSGGIDDYALGIAVNKGDEVMIGGSIGLPYMRYTRTSTFTEADATKSDSNYFNYGLVEEKLNSKGLGINVKLGVIFKASENLRVGVAFHSPTVYSLTEQFEASVTTDTEKGQGVLTDYSRDYADGNPFEFAYLMTTPYKAMLSASYVLGGVADVTQQKGFLSADMEFVNYRSASFRVKDEGLAEQGDVDYLNGLNTAIDNAYKPALNLRLGGELKFTTFMVRGGVAYYGNPYQNIHGEKGSKINLSTGVGYRNKGMFIDLAYMYALTRDVHYAYRLDASPFSGANIRTSGSNIMATIGFKIQ